MENLIVTKQSREFCWNPATRIETKNYPFSEHIAICHNGMEFRGTTQARAEMKRELFYNRELQIATGCGKNTAYDVCSNALDMWAWNNEQKIFQG